MQILRLGASGAQVEQWQNFLIGAGYPDLVADGNFGPSTESATEAYQTAKGLAPDGVVGRGTLAAAITDGFSSFDDASDNEDSPTWPPRPDFPPLVSTEDREQIFGKFSYVASGSPQNAEAITITGGWGQRNIVSVKIPQLLGIQGAPSSCVVYFHHLIVPQLLAMWTEWEQTGLLPLVKTWAGSFVPRFIRGSRTVLSNHAFGTAFDINVPWNALGAEPALNSQTGSVRSLVTVANKHGFYWGGHFGGAYGGGRPDGMHFEAAKVI